MAALKNSKHELFCTEYIVDFNGAQAAIRAGYAESSARVTAAKLLAKDNIRARVEGLKATRLDRTATEADFVLQRHKAIDNMRLSEIMNDDFTLKPLSEWPAVWDTYITSAEISELFEGSGDERTMVGLLKKIKWPDKLRNLELLGKHVDVQAYSDKSQVEHTVSDLERLMQKIDGTSLGPPSQRKKKGVDNG